MRPEIEQPKTALDFCILALRTNHPAPCDITAADEAEAELHALREDRASIEAMMGLLAKEKHRAEYAEAAVDSSSKALEVMECLADCLRLIYAEAGLEIPESFDPQDEAIRLVAALGHR